MNTSELLKLAVVAIVIVSCFVFLLIELVKDMAASWRRFCERRRIAAMPVVYRCDNNGVIALVTAGDYNYAVEKYWQDVQCGKIQSSGGMAILHTIPRTMIFCSDDHFYPCRLEGHKTGNIEQYKQLVSGCRVENRLMFVPYSSFVVGTPEWQHRSFQLIGISEAYSLIYGNRGRLAA